MNTHSILAGRRGGRHTACGAAIGIALLGFAPVVSIADQGTATQTDSKAAEVSFSDLNLSTPEGMRLARDRLHTMATRLCAEPWGGREPPSQRAFSACVDSTVANALRHIAALRQSGNTVGSSVTLSATVRLADLDLSTPEGARIARQRLETVVRRLCGELATRQGLAYPSNHAVCIQDSLAEALAQADALAAVRNMRTARQSAP